MKAKKMEYIVTQFFWGGPDDYYSGPTALTRVFSSLDQAMRFAGDSVLDTEVISVSKGFCARRKLLDNPRERFRVVRALPSVYPHGVVARVSGTGAGPNE